MNGFAALDTAAVRCSTVNKRSVTAPSPECRHTASFCQKRICEKLLTVPRLFQAGQHRNCHRQNGKSAASRSRCYTEADLSGMSRGHGKSGHALTWPLSRWVNTQLSDMGILSTKCFDLFFELLLPLLQQRTHLSLYCFQR